jgi:hypothetical protein
MESPIIRTLGSPVYISKDARAAHPGQPWHNVPSKLGYVRDIRFVNYGRTPAFPYKLSSGWAITDKLPDIPRYNKHSTLLPDLIIPVQLNQHPKSLTINEESEIIGLSDGQLDAIKKGSVCLWFYFCLYYRDFMNDKREFRFCWKFINRNSSPTDIFFDFVIDPDIAETYTKST